MDKIHRTNKHIGLKSCSLFSLFFGLFFLFFLIYLLCGAIFALYVLGVVAALAGSLRIIESFLVWTICSELFTAIHMVTMIAHSFGVMLQICVWTPENNPSTSMASLDDLLDVVQVFLLLLLANIETNRPFSCLMKYLFGSRDVTLWQDPCLV